MRLSSLCLIALFLLSCSQSVPVRVISHYDLSAVPCEDLVREKEKGERDLRTERVKYFIRINRSYPSAVINDQAVDLACRGKFPDAELLLLQIPSADRAYPCAVNNLGVIHECVGNRKKARDFYLEALAAQPSCEAFRHNLRTVDQKEKAADESR